MFTATSQIHFAAELITVLVAAAGLVVVLLRGDLTRQRPVARVALVVGMVAVGGAALVVGAALATVADHREVAAVGAAGSAAVLVGTSGWRAGRRSRRVLAAGAVVGIGAWVGAALVGAPGVLDDAALAAGDLLVVVALVGAGRRSIATRVAANTAGTILLVVLVLSIAISSVISSSVQQSQLVSLRSRTALAADSLLARAATAVTTARLVAADLEAVLPERAGGTGGLSSPGAAAVAIRFRLETVGSFFAQTGLAYLAPGRAPLIAGPAPAGLGAVPVTAGLGCTPGSAGSTGRSSVAVLDGAAYAIGAFPACVAPPLRRVGTVVVAAALGPDALAGLRGSGQSLSLVGPTGTVATVGVVPSAATVAEAQHAPSAGAGSTVRGGQFVATAPLAEAGGAPSVSLVVTESGAQLVTTRTSLDRTLLVIALGGTLLALVLAALTGDRITSGLRRLTVAAQDVRRGGASTRAGIVSSDEVGVLAGAFDAMVDSVEEKNAALRDAALDEGRLRARLEAVVAGMTDALVAVDASGTVTDFNRSAADLTGLEPPSAVGRPAMDVLAFAGAEGAAVAATLADPDGPAWSGTADVVRVDGTVVPVALSSGPLRDPAGDRRGLVVVLRDLRAEQQVERMKTEFLSRVGHELRTPLTGILGYADMLVRRPVPAEQAAVWHQEILLAAKRQLRIVRLLEFFASEGAGRVVLQPEDCSPADLVAVVADDWQGRLPDGHRLEVRVAEGLPDVRVDRRWMELAVGELVDNAVKFSPAGGRVVVSVAGGTDPGARPAVGIAVSDEGLGMAPGEWEGVSAEFVQGDPTDTRSYGGLGLGLSLVQRVVAGHGGTVQCESSPGQGTTIRLWLPASHT